MITEETPMVALGVNHIGRLGLQRLTLAGIITVGDYLRADNETLIDIPFIGETKIRRLDACLAELGFDTAARWHLQYHYWPTAFVYRSWRGAETATYHFTALGNAWEKYPRPMCGLPVVDWIASDRPPHNRTLCDRCTAYVAREVARHA